MGIKNYEHMETPKKYTNLNWEDPWEQNVHKST